MRNSECGIEIVNGMGVICGCGDRLRSTCFFVIMNYELGIMNCWLAGGRQWAAGQRTSCRYPMWHHLSFRIPHSEFRIPPPTAACSQRYQDCFGHSYESIRKPPAYRVTSSNGVAWCAPRGAVRGDSPRIGRVPRGRGESRGGGALPHNVKPPPLAPLVLSPRERTHNS